MRRSRRYNRSPDHPKQEKTQATRLADPDTNETCKEENGGISGALWRSVSGSRDERKAAVREVRLAPKELVQAAAKKLSNDSDAVRSALLVALDPDSGEESFFACLMLREAGLDAVKSSFRCLLSDGEAGPEALDAYTELIRGMFTIEQETSKAQTDREPEAGTKDAVPGEIGSRKRARKKGEWKGIAEDLDAIGVSAAAKDGILKSKSMSPRFRRRIGELVAAAGEEGAKMIIENGPGIVFAPTAILFERRLKSRAAKLGIALKNMDGGQAQGKGRDDNSGHRLAEKRRALDTWKAIISELGRLGVNSTTIAAILADNEMRPYRFRRIMHLVSELGDEGAREFIEAKRKWIRYPNEEKFLSCVKRWKAEKEDGREKRYEKKSADQEGGSDEKAAPEKRLELRLEKESWRHIRSELEGLGIREEIILDIIKEKRMRPSYAHRIGHIVAEFGMNDAKNLLEEQHKILCVPMQDDFKRKVNAWKTHNAKAADDRTEKPAARIETPGEKSPHAAPGPAYAVSEWERGKKAREEISRLIINAYQPLLGKEGSDKLVLRFLRSSLNGPRRTYFNNERPGELMEDTVLSRLKAMLASETPDRAQSCLTSAAGWFSDANEQDFQMNMDMAIFPRTRGGYWRLVLETLHEAGVPEKERRHILRRAEGDIQSVKAVYLALRSMKQAGSAMDSMSVVSAAEKALADCAAEEKARASGGVDSGMSGPAQNAKIEAPAHASEYSPRCANPLEPLEEGPADAEQEHEMPPVMLPSRSQREEAARESLQKMITKALNSNRGNGSAAKRVADLVLSRALTKSFAAKHSHPLGITHEELVERRVQVYLKIAKPERAGQMLELKAGWFGSQEALGSFPNFIASELRALDTSIINTNQGKELWKELGNAGVDSAARAEILLAIGGDIDLAGTVQKRIAGISRDTDALTRARMLCHLGATLAAGERDFLDANARYETASRATASLRRIGICQGNEDDVLFAILALQEPHFTLACKRLSGMDEEKLVEQKGSVASLLQGIATIEMDPDTDEADSTAGSKGMEGLTPEEVEVLAYFESSLRKAFGNLVDDTLVEDLFPTHDSAIERIGKITKSMGAESTNPLVAPLLASSLSLENERFDNALREARIKIVSSELSRHGILMPEAQSIAMAAGMKAETPVPRILKRIRELADAETGLGPDFGAVVLGFHGRERLFTDAEFFVEQKEELVSQRKERLILLQIRAAEVLSEASGIGAVAARVPSMMLLSKLDIIEEEFSRIMPLERMSAELLLNEISIIRNVVNWRLKKALPEGPLKRCVTQETGFLLEEIKDSGELGVMDNGNGYEAEQTLGPDGLARMKELVGLFGMKSAHGIISGDQTILICPEEEFKERVEHHLEANSLASMLKGLRVPGEVVATICRDCADPLQAMINAERASKELGNEAGKYIAEHPDLLLKGETEFQDAILVELLNKDSSEAKDAKAGAPERDERRHGIHELAVRWKDALQDIRGIYRQEIAGVMARNRILVPDHSSWIASVVNEHAEELSRGAIDAVKARFSSRKTLEDMIRSITFDRQTSEEIRLHGIEPNDVSVALCKGFNYRGMGGCTSGRTELQTSTFIWNLKRAGLKPQPILRALERLGVIKPFHNGSRNMVALVAGPKTEVGKRIISAINEQLARAMQSDNVG